MTLALAHPAGAFDIAGFKLAWPADCVLGESCHIQQYPDRDTGPGAADYTCGPLSYDGHDGTDIALPTRAAMAKGVAVLAAAPGVVKGVRDGVADFVPFEPGKECGNGVLVEHEGGWQTQYCHLRQGSVAVEAGDRVEVGTHLGLIGQSGMAEFPHVHLSVRHNGEKIDPFEPEGEACSLVPGPGLWAEPEGYEPGGLLDAGFSAAVPSYEAIKAGLPTEPLPGAAPGLVLWAFAFGARAGDEMRFEITGPEGEVLQEVVTLEKTQAQMFRAMGKKLRAAAWTAGEYRGVVVLLRGGAVVDQMETAVQVLP